MENEVTNINNQMNENNQKGQLEEKNSNGGYIKQILTGIGAAIALGVGGKIAYDKSKEDEEDDKKRDKEDDKESDKEDDKKKDKEDDKESDKEDDKEKEKEKDKKDNKEEDSTLKYHGTDDKDSFILKLKKKLSQKPKVICGEIDKENYIWVNLETNNEDYDKERVKSFICPINKKIMEDPVITPYGTTYEKSAILNWIKKNKTDYINNKVLTEDMLVTDYLLKRAIKEYNKSIKL